MKNSNTLFAATTSTPTLLLLLFIIVGIFACSNDDDAPAPTPTTAFQLQFDDIGSEGFNSFCQVTNEAGEVIYNEIYTTKSGVETIQRPEGQQITITLGNESTKHSLRSFIIPEDKSDFFFREEPTNLDCRNGFGNPIGIGGAYLHVKNIADPIVLQSGFLVHGDWGGGPGRATVVSTASMTTEAEGYHFLVLQDGSSNEPRGKMISTSELKNLPLETTFDYDDFVPVERNNITLPTSSFLVRFHAIAKKNNETFFLDLGSGRPFITPENNPEVIALYTPLNFSFDLLKISAGLESSPGLLLNDYFTTIPDVLQFEEHTVISDLSQDTTVNYSLDINYDVVQTNLQFYSQQSQTVSELDFIWPVIQFETGKVNFNHPRLSVEILQSFPDLNIQTEFRKITSDAYKITDGSSLPPERSTNVLDELVCIPYTASIGQRTN